MILPCVNRPAVLATSGVALRTATVTVVPRTIAQGGLIDPTLLVTLNDADDLPDAASGNVLWSAPLSALSAGMVVPLSGVSPTSNGLVVSSVPPGCSIAVDFG